MGNDDRPSAIAKGRFQLRDVDLIGRNDDVHKNRYEAVLNDRIYGGWETGRHGYNFVTRT